MGRDNENRILTERLQCFIEEVFPCELLPWLTCLTEADKQQIQCDQDRYGDIKATDTLVDRLKRRQDGFSQFVIALRENGSEHVAMLLDPEMKVEKPAKAPPDLISGTVVDMCFKGNLADDSGRDLREVEAVIADEYGQPSSSQTIQLRRNLSKLLPPGAVFYKTKKGSVVCVFRVCRVSAAQELWEMYQNNTLHEKILQYMLTDEVKAKMAGANLIAKSAGEVGEIANKEILPTLKMQLYMMEERFEEAVNHLRESNPNETECYSAITAPPVYLDSDQARAHSLTLREYQKELAAPALEGQNTIICAPTNSGKTYVAIHIARRHLDKYTNGTAEGASYSDEKPKVIFIVSTLSLVLQQKERFEYFLNDKYRVADISGGNAIDVPLEFLLVNNDVVVLTAQILVNALRKSVVRLTDISMLLFDECHHTNKDHPYNKIMERYMALKRQPGMKLNTLPQVIGLTASLGVGKSKTLVKAKEHILKLCCNLDAELISTVKENVEELRENVNLPESKLYSVSKPKDSRFEIVIGKVMDVIERKVGTACGKPPQGRADQEYRQWVESLYNHAVAEGNRFLVTLAEQLREYHISLTIYGSTRMKDARRRLGEYFKGLDETKFTENDRKLKGLYTQAEDALTRYVKEHGEPRNPMLVKLKELVVSYHTPGENTSTDADLQMNPKGIIFTQTRESTRVLEEWVAEDQDLNNLGLRALRLLGAGDGWNGMTQHERDSVVEKFKRGDINLIIATTVAEEGLDIKECNYVIRYNMTGNEISSVQSRGRVRTDMGEYNVLAAAKSGVLERECLNQFKEILMTGALAAIQSLPSSQFKQKITSLQKEALTKCQLREETKRQNTISDSNDISFHCRKCNEFACKANEVKRIQDFFHVVPSKDFMKKANIEEHLDPKTIDGITKKNKLRCGNCGEDWGITILADGIELPCIKIVSFALRSVGENGKGKRYKKWSQCPLEIKEVDIAEISAELGTGIEEDDGDAWEMDLN